MCQPAAASESGTEPPPRTGFPRPLTCFVFISQISGERERLDGSVPEEEEEEEERMRKRGLAATAPATFCPTLHYTAAP